MTQIDRVKLSLALPPEVNQSLEEIANELHTTKSDVLRRSLVLMVEAHKARKDNKIVGVLGTDKTLEKEFIGI